MRSSRQDGTTLVELLVGSVLLVSVVGLVTLALAVVFEMYAASQQRGSIDQDGQYIIARLQYLGSQQNSHEIVSHTSSADFASVGSQLSQVSQSVSADGGIFLTDPNIAGEYTSAPTATTYETSAREFVAVVDRPAGTQIRYQVAIADKVNGSCANAQYIFVGEDGTPSTYFNTDHYVIPENNDDVGFENPGSCFRYKVFLEGSGGQTPVLRQVFISR